MEYAEIGQGEPILVIHGAGGGFDQALDMAGGLAEQGFRLIAPSRFGYLRSSLPEQLTAEMQADAFVELLDNLGIAKVNVASISAGAWSALQLAIRHPNRVRALVLLVPADNLPPGITIQGGAIVRAIFNSDFIAWAALKVLPVLPGGMSRMMLGTDPAVMRAADHKERARVQQILEHLLPVGPRVAGMNFDVATAAQREPYAHKRSREGGRMPSNRQTVHHGKAGITHARRRHRPAPQTSCSAVSRHRFTQRRARLTCVVNYLDAVRNFFARRRVKYQSAKPTTIAPIPVASH